MPSTTAGEHSFAVFRAVLAIACLNAAVLASVAVSRSAGGLSSARAAIAGTLVVCVSVVLLTRARQIVYFEKNEAGRWEHAKLFGALAGVLMLLDPSSAELLFAGALTPVGVCVLVRDWNGGAWCGVLAAGGFAATSLLPGGPTSLEAALSNLVPMLVVMAGGLIPAMLADRVVKEGASDLEYARILLRGERPDLKALYQERRVKSRERNRLLIEARLAAGEEAAKIHAETNIPLATISNLEQSLKDATKVRQERDAGRSIAEISFRQRMKERRVRYLLERKRVREEEPDQDLDVGAR